MFRMSAWPVRHVFRLLAIAAVIACVGTAATVVLSYQRQQSLRSDYRVVLNAKDAVRSIQAAGTQMILDEMITERIADAGEIGLKSRDEDLAQIEALVAHVNGLAIAAEEKVLIRAVGTSYRELEAWLENVGIITNASDLSVEYRMLSGKAAAAVRAALAALDARGDILDADAVSSGKTANLITMLLCLITAALVGGLMLSYGHRVTLVSGADRLRAGRVDERVSASP